MTKRRNATLSLATLFLLCFSFAALADDQEDNLPVSAEQQGELTPDDVLSDLLAGNQRFIDGKLPQYDVAANLEAATKGQYPMAYILSCVDSRVPVEHIFHQGIGDVFVGRVAGNIENEDQLGSMEFATKYAGAKLIMVLGHEACGAVKGAIAGVEDGNLTLLLEKIRPAVRHTEDPQKGDRSAENARFVEHAVERNVQRTVDDIRERSRILSQLEKEGKIKIVGAVYSLESGEVTVH